MRRFILLNYEPYLSILSEQKFVEPFIKKAISFDDTKKKIVLDERSTISLEDIDLSKHIKDSYKYENIDYIENIILTKLNFNKERVSVKDFLELFNNSLEFLVQSLFEGHKIKDLESFSYVKQLIEPNILFIFQLLKLGYASFPPHQKDLLDLFIENKGNYIDLHVHGETSYNFHHLINFIIKNWGITVNTILREILKLKKERKRYKKHFKNLLAIVATYLYLIEAIDENKVYYIHLQSFKNKDFIPDFLKGYSSALKRFNYLYFLKKLLVLSTSKNEKSFNRLIAISTLLKINTLNQDLAFSGTYKGLKYMGEYFNGFLKKTYQKVRFKLKKQKDEVISSAVDRFKNNKESYIEIRLSPDVKQLKYWFTQVGKQNNIKFIVHSQKLDLESFTKGYSYFEKSLWKKLWIDKRKQEGIYYIVKNLNKFSEYIVGFDAASVEYWTPPWVYRVIFKFLKNYFKVYANKDIGITFHAGEDFIDVATGLRYVYESIHFLEAKRIGHGLSLGVLLERYHLKYPVITMHPIMYLFHLLWLNHLVLKYKAQLQPFELPLKEEIMKFFNEFFNTEEENKDDKDFVKEISELAKGDFYLGLNEIYNNLGFIHILYSKASSYRNQNPIYRVLYNTFQEVFKDIPKTKRIHLRIIKPMMDRIKRKNKRKTIAPLLPIERMSFEDQLSFLDQIQQLVIELVKKNSVAVETCPSSNIILYNIVSFKDHPILSQPKLVEELKITVNTDNPLLLNTNIALEYTLVEYLFGREVLEKVIENGKRFVF